MNEKQIFNFMSNSYSQFLSYYKNEETFLSQTVNNESNMDTICHSFHMHHSIYFMQKKQARLYQFIFIGFSIIFFLLGAIVYLNPTNWACNIYFNHCAFIKNAAYTFCFFLSFVTLLVGYFTKPDKDTAYYLFNKMKNKLKQLYRHRLKEVGLFTAFQEEKRIKRLFFQHNYYQALEKMLEQQQHTMHLLEKIRGSEMYCITAKEDLVCQSLLEFHSTLESILHSFQQKSYLLTLNH
jgi:hypothetical protein